MRNWCAAAVMSAFFVLPVCARQNNSGTDGGDGSAAAPATAVKASGDVAVGDITPAARNLFALPESPRPQPFPSGTVGSADSAPGLLVPKFEVAGMFNYVNYNPGDPFQTFSAYGGSGSFTWNVNKWLGFTEELGGLSYNRNVNGSSIHGGLTTFLAGPRLNIRKFKYFVPFGEFLLGGTHAGVPLTGTSGQSSFSILAGGGVDVVLTKNIAWRFAEIDYLMTNFSGSSLGGNGRQDNLRLGTGIVVRFGLPHEAPPAPVNHPPVAACSATPTSLFAGSGDTVAVHVNASDPDNDPLTYSYTATAGAVDGNGPDARWNSSGVNEGTYTITAKVDDGKGGTTSCATDITVQPRPNRPPTATLSVDRSPIHPGEKTGITCTGTDPDGDPLTYSYSSSGGQISGSGTSAQFDATGLAPGNYTVKCVVNDGRGGTGEASGNVEVQEAPQVHELEVKLRLHSIYFPTALPSVARPMGGLLASQAVTLDVLAVDFKSYLAYRPNAHLILGGHADIRGGKEYNQLLSERRVEKAKSYLIEKGVPADHIDTKAYGEEQNMSDEEVKKLLEDDPDLTPAEKKTFLANLLTVRLANNRRVDVTISTTGEQSVRRFPFNAKDALTLLSRKVGEGAAGNAKKPAAKKPAPKP
ncbi:MAG: OmpA family protein [Candidatus Acidiferrum sp.]|jgi:outer membrane protein OmpA-like peptidoglycan-associated protein